MTKLQTIIPKVYHNKVVFPFARMCMEGQAKSWITTLNETSRYQLLFAESLINTLFVATLQESRGGGSKRKLLKKQCQRARDKFGMINDYHVTFDPQNLVNFRNLVIVVIRKGSPEFF